MAMSQNYRCEPKRPGTTEAMFFNGLGGHSKPDAFPQPLKKPMPFTKKPKGISRPKSSISQSSDRNLAKIDQFFNLDTP